MKDIIFDFGAVLVDWNPHYLLDDVFGSHEKAQWFLNNVCTSEWNSQMDGGKPFAQGVAELTEQFPQWEAEIRLYHTGWEKMMGSQIPGMEDLLKELKASGHRIFGLTNWSSETFYKIEGRYPIFSLLDGKVVSGDVGLLKPDPAIYRLLMDRFGLSPENCVFIDDNPANVHGAEAVGIRAIQFTSAAALRCDLAAL